MSSRILVVVVLAALTACGDGIQSPSVPTTLTLDGPPVLEVLGGAPWPFPDPLQARLSDGDGRPMPGLEVTFSAQRFGDRLMQGQPLVSCGKHVIPATSFTDADGVARAVFSVSPGCDDFGYFRVEAKAGDTNRTLSATRVVILGLSPRVLATSGAGQRDTVDATLAEPLVVEVRDLSGKPLPGRPVLFRNSGAGGRSLLRFFAVAGGLQDSITVVTDAAGTATVRVRFSGSIFAGHTTAHVTAGGPLLDVPFTVLPGNPVYLIVDPSDRVLAEGASRNLQVRGRDRYGNHVDPEVTLSSRDPAIARVTDRMVTGLSFGETWVLLTSALGRDSIPVYVLPNATIAISHPRSTGTSNPGDTAVFLQRLGFGYSGERDLGLGRQPDWAPDGSQLVFVRNKRLFVTDTLGDAREVIPAFRDSPGIWVPKYADMQTIYFMASRDGGLPPEIWRSNTDGGGVTRVFADDGVTPDTAALSVSPDGRRLTFAARFGASTVPEIVILDVGTGKLSSLGVRGRYPLWSPAGDYIVYTDPLVFERLHSVRPDGSPGPFSLSLPPFTMGGRAYDWSPDGRYLLGHSYVIDVGARKAVYSGVWREPSWRPH